MHLTVQESDEVKTTAQACKAAAPQPHRDRHHKQHLEKAVPPFDGWRDRRANADSTLEFLFSLEGLHHTRECSQQARARAPAEVR